MQKRKVFDIKKVRQEAIMSDLVDNGAGGVSDDYYKPQGKTG